MIGITAKGSFANTEAFLRKARDGSIYSMLDKYGPQGVAALQAATPVDTSDTANSWDYQIVRTKGVYKIIWLNKNVEGGENVAILIQYGHGTGTGGYVAGYDYINPAMRPIFDSILADIRKAVTSV